MEEYEAFLHLGPRIVVSTLRVKNVLNNVKSSPKNFNLKHQDDLAIVLPLCTLRIGNKKIEC